MIKGFKDFIRTGNALELAVAVIIGAAFKPIVDSITAVIMGTIGALVGKPNFDSVLQFTINGSDPIQPGTIITAVVNFFLIAAAVYVAIVMPMNTVKARTVAEADAQKKTESDEAEKKAETSEDIALLREIRDLLAARSTHS